jgi:DNA-binding NarL/FixJ family response regulator
MAQINIFEFNLSPFTMSKISAFNKKNDGKMLVHKINPNALHLIKEGYLFLQIESNKDLPQLRSAMKYNVSTIVLLSNIDLLRKILNTQLKGLLIIPFDYAELARIIKDLSKESSTESGENIKAMPYKTKDHSESPDAIKNFNPHIHSTNQVRHNLTFRELELLHSLSNGFLYKEIADLKGITLGTVKQHLHKIYSKLNVNNKIEALNAINAYSNV